MKYFQLFRISGEASNCFILKIKCILKIRNAYAIMPTGKKMQMSIADKKTNPRKDCEYFRGFFLICGEVDRAGIE